MARNKYPEETIKQILEISLKLFIEKGYDETTIQDIVNHLGMSKGAIYHHFKSKEEIMNAIIKKNFEENIFFNEIYNNSALTGLQKIKKLFCYNIADKNKQATDKLTLSLTKNSKIVVKHLEDTLQYVAPMVANLIEEGMTDGSITATNSKAASEVIMLLFNFWINPAMFVTTKKDFLTKINFLKSLVEQMGIPFIDDAFIAEFITYYENLFENTVYY